MRFDPNVVVRLGSGFVPAGSTIRITLPSKRDFDEACRALERSGKLTLYGEFRVRCRRGVVLELAPPVSR